jgi:hypothetical protein
MTNQTSVENNAVHPVIKVEVPSRISFWYVGAGIGLAAGIIAILIGILLTIAAWLLHIEHIQVSFDSLINILFYSALPSLFFGAYCLDKLDDQNAKAKKQRDLQPTK